MPEKWVTIVHVSSSMELTIVHALSTDSSNLSRFKKSARKQVSGTLQAKRIAMNRAVVTHAKHIPCVKIQLDAHLVIDDS